MDKNKYKRQTFTGDTIKKTKTINELKFGKKKRNKKKFEKTTTSQIILK